LWWRRILLLLQLLNLRLLIRQLLLGGAGLISFLFLARPPLLLVMVNGSCRTGYDRRPDDGAC
jgi:hypothetical protein